MKLIKIKLAKFNALSGPDRRLLLTAMAWLPLFRLGLRVLGLSRFQAWLQHENPPVDTSLSQDDIVRIATLVNIAAVHGPFYATCLTRSLLLVWMLRRRGIASQLRIGVRINQGVLDAHAWVEYAGLPINDQKDVGQQFAAFDEILPPSAFYS